MNENSKYAVFCIVLCQACSFVRIGIGLSYLNPCTPALQNFVNITYKERYNVTATKKQSDIILACIQSAYDFGALIGAVSIHFCVNYLSRRQSVALPHVLWIVSSVLMAPVSEISKSYDVLIVGRAISGIARGIAFSTVPLYVAEITNRKNLAFFQGLLAWLVEGGLIIGAVIGHPKILGNSQAMRFLFITPVSLSVIFFICFPFISNSPCYLMVKEFKKKDEKDSTPNEKTKLLSSPKKNSVSVESGKIFQGKSFDVLERLRKGDEADHLVEYETIREEIVRDTSLKVATIGDFLRVPHYWRQLVATMAIVTGAQFTTIALVLYYSDQMFMFVGLSENEASNYTLGLLVFVFLCTCVSVMLTNRIGAKKLYVYGGLACIPGLLMLIVTTSDLLNFPGEKYLNVIGSMLIILGFQGPKQSLSIYPSELTTCITRPKVLWLSSIGYYIVAILVSFVTPIMINYIQGFAYLPWMILFIAVLVYVKVRVPDTHQRPIADIQAELRGVYDVISDYEDDSATNSDHPSTSDQATTSSDDN